jgi:hypothetical protein
MEDKARQVRLLAIFNSLSSAHKKMVKKQVIVILRMNDNICFSS